MSHLYQTDFNRWVEQQAIAIKNRDINAMDWDNLLEEVEDMGASQKRALRSYYYRLVEHILKLRDWNAEKERNTAKWRIEVTNFRRAIKGILKDSPSLNNYLKDNHLEWFNDTVDTIVKTESFTITDITAIPLTTMLDDEFFG
jgi:hypothetical protein